MNGPKRTSSSGEPPDLSHHPTRKVDSMSSLVAEMLLRDPDTDATSPGLPAVTAVGADAHVGAEGVEGSAAHDAVGLDMARLIEVRSSVAPSPPSFASGRVTDDDDDARLRAMRSKSHAAVWLLAALVFVAALAAATVLLSR